MLKETVEYLENQKKVDENYTYEIIVVDDGSRDNTIDVALEFAKTTPEVDIRVLALDKNRGKGGAVTQVNEMISHEIFFARVFICYKGCISCTW